MRFITLKNIQNLFFFICFVYGQLSAVEIGKKAPTLVGKYLQKPANSEGFYSINSNDQNTIRVLNLFWTACKPCRKEIPEIAKLEKKFSKVNFILVNVFNEKPEQVKNYLSTLKAYPKNVIITSQIIRSRYKDQDAQDLYLPTTIILDRNNLIQAVYYGYKKDLIQKMSKKLNALLKL